MITIFANVSFGLYALMPLGWAFMVAIIALEPWILSRLLFGTSWNSKAVWAAVVANLASGAFGFGLSLLLNGGWWLVVWMPWVGRNEIDAARHLVALAIYYLVAFVLSVGIEGLIENRRLRLHAGERKVWRACVIANLASYAAGSAAMYSWSFGLLR